MPGSRFTADRQGRGFLTAGAVLAALAIVCGVLSIAQYRTERAFDSAQACVSGAASDDACIRSLPATVAAISITTGKDNSYAMRLTGSASVAGTYRFPDEEDLLDTSDVGDPVIAEVWHGKVIAIRDDDTRALTIEAPRYGFQRAWTTGLALILLAVVLALVYAWDVQSIGYRSIVTTLVGWQAVAYLIIVMTCVAAVLTALVAWFAADAPAGWVLPISFAVVSCVTVPRYLVSAHALMSPNPRNASRLPTTPKKPRFTGAPIQVAAVAGRTRIHPWIAVRRLPWLLILGTAAVLALVTGAVAGGRAYQGQMSTAADFRQARPCGAFDPPSGECITYATLEITDKRIVDGGDWQRSIWVYSPQTFSDVQIDFPKAARDFVDALPLDSSASVATWRGRVVTVTSEQNVVEPTADNPGLSHAGTLVAAILSGTAALLLVLVLWLARTRRRRSRTILWQMGSGLRR